MNRELRIAKYPTGQTLYIVEGDITKETVDAIVNPANSQLMHGGGLAAIIARKGGSKILQESTEWVRKHGPVPHEAPAFTSGGNLPCRIVIHAVGPVWGSGNEDNKLAAAVSGVLTCACTLNLESIAIPAISTGIFGFPKERAANIIFKTIQNFFGTHQGESLMKVRIVLFGQRDANLFLTVFSQGIS